VRIAARGVDEAARSEGNSAHHWRRHIVLTGEAAASTRVPLDLYVESV
jgi:hypothetical protein